MKFPRLIQAAITTLTGIVYIVTARASLDFGSIGAGLQATLTITAPGAVLGDYVEIGMDVAPEAGLHFSGMVTAADTVTVTCVNNTAGALDPAVRNVIARVTRRAI